MILGLMTLCIVVMRCFPQTSLARLLNKALVDQPLAWLSKLRRRDIIFLFAIVALLLVASDFIMLFGVSELLVIGGSLSVYFDAILATAAVTIAATAVTAWRAVRARLSMWLGVAAQRHRRAVRERRTRKTRQPKSLNDDDAPAWGLAFAV